MAKVKDLAIQLAEEIESLSTLSFEEAMEYVCSHTIKESLQFITELW